MLDIKEYLKQTKTVLVTQEAFDELVKKSIRTTRTADKMQGLQVLFKLKRKVRID